MLKNQYGCEDEKEVRIHVKPLNVVILPDKFEGCAPLNVTFYDKTAYNSPVKSKRWILEDGTVFTTLDSFIEYTFEETGEYNVILEVETMEGCFNISSTKVKVGQKIEPSFRLDQDSLCYGDLLYIKNTTDVVGPPKIESLKWHIYENSNPFRQDSVLLYFPYTLGIDYRDSIRKKSNWYNVALITNDRGCKDTTIKEDSFFVKNPFPKIASASFNPCQSQRAILTNLSIGADDFIWRIYTSKGDTLTSTENIVPISKAEHGNSLVTLTVVNFKTGCVATVEEDIEFLPEFRASILRSGDQCSPANISYQAFIEILNDSIWKNTADYSDYQFSWVVNKGTDTTKSRNDFIQFENAGDYPLELFVKQKITGCTDTLLELVNITGPKVDGSLSYTGSCPPLPITFTTALNPSNFDSLFWVVEGRKIPIVSSGNISDTLFMPGTDSANLSTIQLVGIDSNGCVGIKTFKVPVTGPKTAYIKTRRLGSCAGQNFIFSAETPGYGSDDFEYFWDFGNGDTSSHRLNNVYYEDVGSYDVVLKIIDSDGCTSRYIEHIDIEQERLRADFSADSIDTDCPPLFIEFKNLSTAPNRKIKSYYWEFGDGTTSVEPTPSKLYLRAGRFTVKLFIEDDWGCTDSVVYDDFVIVNGPEGSYDFDKKEGCVPLTVNFTSKTKRADFYEWDMGDGNVIKNTPTYTHTYTIPGRFIPLLILSDTFGCSYTLPPIDTIYVDPYPEPDFSYIGTCVNYPIHFLAFNTNGLEVDTILWEMETPAGVDTFYDASLDYTFYNIDKPIVKLTMISKNGCSNTITKLLSLAKLEAKFDTKNNANCVGSNIELKNTTLSDTTLSTSKWIINGTTYEAFEPSFVASKLGPVDITLIQQNVLGCIDTVQGFSVVIGDTISPLDMKTLRVTVDDNSTIQLDYKESTMADFKSYLIFKENGTRFEQVAEITDRALTSYFSSNNNTLDRSYCFKVEVKNACELISDTLTDYKHCTIETDAVGGRNHNLVTWSAYIGWDSISNYRIYRKELNNTSVLQPVGMVDGDSLRFVDSMLYCNIEYSYRIEGIEAQGNQQVSFSDTANAIPEWDYLPPPNKLIRATVEDDLEILVEWDSSHNSIIPIEKYILEKSRDGILYSKIYEGDEKTFEYLDKNVWVDDYSYFYRTYAVDECNDTTNIWNYGKTILLDADTSADQRPQLDWSHYEGWTEDITYYAVEIENSDHSFSEIATFPTLDTTFRDLITDLNQRPNYCYRIVAYKDLVVGKPQIISISNEDCSPVRSKIYYPNAFTPNGDKLNDFYVTPSQYIKDYHIMIFTRWGEKVFESFNVNNNWDGTYLGEDAQMDAFAVIVISTGVDGVRRVHKGTVTVVR